ncbi:LysR family glycine cleavage system transcriptional activator [Stella humosa]|uniref:LysR family glycine cleavage system transcriptional activator n=1 Tax=Stella humosa TaxID=94 RepID=A0A3N1MDL6_9PROT|nr:LysR substrate-binding domain-containing protein [Stella humosa]ROQ01813.1 LysR family glycine cleavage system transcriptional activator [Stella humosa]BBK32200.1 LysR family transcriptional regulator [Stella humosa]
MQTRPPFDALIAFDAALRLGSMTLAAGELGVTQSAVSHRIRRLEAFMGTALLLRRNAGLAPTPAGAALAEGLTALLDDLAGLRSRCRAADAPDNLRVGVGAALAGNWLVRRLPGFAAACPGIAIELAVVENEAQAHAPDIDLRILWVPAAEARSTSTQRPLFQECVFPVCHPALLPAAFVPGDPALLSTLPLLHKGPAGRGTGAEWSWAAWLDRLGLPPRPGDTLRFATIGTAIAAALEGAGAVLARSMLVHDALADGRLVRLLPDGWDMPSSKVHVLRWPAALSGDDRVRRFAAWLVERTAETAAAP